jgi:aspartate aminotransferase
MNEAKMKISRYAQSIAGSPTLALNEKAKALAAQGKPVINLSVGEPKNETPAAAIERAVAALNTRQIKYTATGGIPALKKAVAQYTQTYYGQTPNPKNILITVGAKQSLVNALCVTVDPTDEVILLAPYWVSYPEMTKIVHGKVVTVSPPAGALEPTLADIQTAITDRTKVIILNNPNNPSGVVYDPDLVAALVEFCEANEIFLIMDDIYHQLVYGDTPWVPGYQFTKKDIDSSYIIVINGISKTYGMTGFRIGWVVAAEAVISQMNKFQAQITSGVSVVTQEAAVGALNEAQSEVTELRNFIKANRDIVMSSLGTLEDVSCVEPKGAFYCLPDFSYYNTDSMALADFLLEKAFIAVVPGAAFGMEGHVRISYAGDPDEIAEGIRRIRWALDPNSPPEIFLGSQKVTRDW